MRNPTNAPHLIRGSMTAALVLAFSAFATEEASTQERTLDDFRQQGLQAALQTKAALGGQLTEAIASGGPEGAVAFCNTRAIPITTQASEELGMEVVRVSDKPRNPANAASEAERAIIEEFKASLAARTTPKPALREHDNAVVGYYPIVTNALCLQCHGTKGQDISAATQAVIDRQYPDDQATGYGENELRGLFVVTMEKPAGE